MFAHKNSKSFPCYWQINIRFNPNIPHSHRLENMIVARKTIKDAGVVLPRFIFGHEDEDDKALAKELAMHALGNIQKQFPDIEFMINEGEIKVL